MNEDSLNIDRFFEAYRGKSVFFRPNPGNAGDALIGLAALELLEIYGIKYKIAAEDSDLDGQIVFYSGGGNLVKYYSHCAEFIKTWKSRVKEFILMPHTVNNHSELLSQLSDNVTIFCREKETYNYLKTFSNLKSVHLTHDLAFRLNFENDLVRYNSPNNLMKIAPPKTVLKALIKKEKSPRFFLRRIDSSNTLNAFRADVESAGRELPKNNIDLSYWCNQKVEMMSKSVIRESAIRLTSTINKFEKICTDRLHIAIAAAKLNKHVDFYNNSYNKNKNVYEYSMKGIFPRVIWKGDYNPTIE